MTPNPNENQAEKHSGLDYTIPGNSFSLRPAIESSARFVALHFTECTSDAVADCCHCQTNFLARTALDYHERLAQLNSQRNALAAELSTLRKELEAAKKAQEWVDKCGSDILSLAGDYIEWFALDETSKYSIARNELRELLNNGKDGE